MEKLSRCTRAIVHEVEEQERGIWSDVFKILDNELVLEASVIDNLGSETMIFDRKTSFIGSHKRIPIMGVAWGIKMIANELATLMNTVRAAVTAIEQALGRAGKGKAKKTAKNGAKNQVKQESDTGERPISPKGKPKNSNGKRLIRDDEDELPQEPKSPPQKKSRK